MTFVPIPANNSHTHANAFDKIPASRKVSHQSKHAQLLDLVYKYLYTLSTSFIYVLYMRRKIMLNRSYHFCYAKDKFK